MERVKEQVETFYNSLKTAYNTLTYVYIYETVDHHPYGKLLHLCFVF